MSDSGLSLIERIRLLFRVFILNDPESMHSLGAWYGSGDVKNISLEESVRKSYFFYRKAADLDHPESQYDLGFMIIAGEIRGANPEDGISLIKKSAQNGFVPAKELLDNSTSEFLLIGMEKSIQS